jgi:death on curing protein
VKEPDFLTLDDLLALHADRIEKYGGSLGIRDLAGLSSALGVPGATFDGQYLHPSIAEMAGAYLFHVSQAHGFIDGNKRAALAAALAFLSLNGHELVAEPDTLYELCIGTAGGTVSKAEVATFFVQHLRARAP